MDPKNSTLVGEPSIRQLTCGRPEEVGRVPRVPPQAQAPTRRAEGQAGDKLQHPPDQAPSVQPTSLHAHRRQDDHRYPARLERSSRLREGLRGVAPG